MEHFSYHSSESHTRVINGKRNCKKTTVNVKNGKGTKKVTTTHGSKSKSSTHRLTPSEIKNIKGRKFMPNFFSALSARNDRGLRLNSNSRSRTLKKEKGSR